MQFMMLCWAQPQARADFPPWCLEVLAPALQARSAALQRLVVNLAVPAPEGFAPYGASESLEGEAPDMVLQLWAPELGTIETCLAPLRAELARHTRQCHAYAVTDTEVLNRQGPAPRATALVPTPGFKLLRGLYFHADLGPAAAQRLWAHHGALAQRVHVGLSRYARHWVDAVLTPEAPAIHGLSDLHFPDAQALCERYFDSARGREEITHDVGHFIRGGTQRFFGREYVWK